MRNLVLIGFIGSGKSSVSRVLAESLELTFFDTDGVIEKNTGRKITEIVREQDERVVRLLEREAVQRISQNENLVITCSGGVVLSSETVKNPKKRHHYLLGD